MPFTHEKKTIGAMGHAASIRRGERVRLDGGFTFTTNKGDPQFKHYFAMSEMGMSDILVKHLLIRDGYRGNEVKEYDAISTALGSDPTKRKQKAWKRARDKLNQEKESIRDALKEAQGQKKTAVSQARNNATEKSYG